MVECNSAITDQLQTVEADLATLEKWKEGEVVQKDKLCTACSECILDVKLLCGHPICLLCRDTLRDFSDNVSCPICRSTTHIDV